MGHVSPRFKLLSPPLGRTQSRRTWETLPPRIVGGSAKRSLTCSKRVGEGVMQDLLWIGVTVTFFVLSIAYVRFCERLK